MDKVLIYLEQNHMAESVELLEIAKRIYGDNAKIYAVVFGEKVKKAEDYFDVIFCQKANQADMYDVRWMAGCLDSLHKKYQFQCIIIPAIQIGRMLAPVLAMRIGTGLVADVTDVLMEEGQVQMIRPAFDGKIMAAIVNKGLGPIMMSARPGVFKYRNPVKKHAEVIQCSQAVRRQNKVLLLGRCPKRLSNDIREARLLVSGGGGIERKFGCLTELADELGGMVSASRRIVDNQIAPRSIQVGQSGKTVSPRLYIALGIYGSLQHIEGLKDIEHIISVNTNKNAPICSLSEIVVVGDAAEFAERLTEKIKIETQKEKEKAYGNNRF